jgi:hypothetical protein
MNDRFVADLPQDALEALDAERARPDMSQAARVRARMRVQASLLQDYFDHQYGHLSNDAAPARRFWSRLRRVNPALTAAVGFVVGVGAGLALHARMDAAHRLAPTIAIPVAPAPVRAAPTTSPATTGAEPATSAPLHDLRAVDSATPRTPSASTLVAERALLDVAHSALASGNANGALAALGQHAHRYPNGVYREEREAITVQCLRALGRSDEAARRAAAFRARYPKSLFLSIVGEEPETDSSSSPQAPR